MMRTSNLLTIGLMTMALAACSTAQAAPAGTSQAAASPDWQEQQRAVTVVGTGKVSLVPDVARVNIGADAMADTVSAARREVEGRTEAILVALEQMGVEAKDIQTSHYSIHYEREPTPRIPMESVPAGHGGYRVSSVMRVTVRDVERAGAVLDAAVDAGANQVHGVTFTVEDESTWQGQARGKAMADARARADELASLADVRLGQVLSVSEVIGGFATGMVSYERSTGGGIAPAELELSTRVQVTFAIR
ncbi:MAG: SIMPL domain-containing protein [Anaerolineae bacterium]|jgi:hypothetical protein